MRGPRPYRDRVVPQDSPGEQPHDHDETKPKGPGKSAKSEVKLDPDESLGLCSTLPDEHGTCQASRYIDWATLLKRSFGIDVLRCPKCRGRMAIIALISQRKVAGKILDHVRLPNDPEPLGDGVTLAYDVTGEPIGDWVVGTDPEHPEPQGYEPKWTECSELHGVHAGLRSAAK